MEGEGEGEAKRVNRKTQGDKKKNEKKEKEHFKLTSKDFGGIFDYASLSTDDLDHAVLFAILVMSEDHGAVIVEARPPAH